MNASHTIIIRPIVTELSIKESESGRYSFLVANDANKTQIKQAVETLFKVSVTKVYTINVKTVRKFMTRKGRFTKESTYKKARVLLKKGQKIDVLTETEAK